MTAHPDPADFIHLNSAAGEIERALIGTCLMVPGSLHRTFGLVQPDHFSEAVHGMIWQAMRDMTEAGHPVNPLTVTARLGNLDVAGGLTLRAYIAQCAADTHCPAGYVASFAAQVRMHWALREVARHSEEVRTFALSPGADAKAIIAESIQRLDEVRCELDHRSTQSRSIGAATHDIIDVMNRKMMGEVIDSCISTGLRDLDRKLGGGFKPGELIVIAGRPGMGKSLVAASCARQMAKAGHAGGLFSLEMPEAQIGSRILADELFGGPSIITGNHILQASLGANEAERAIVAQRNITDLPLRIDDSSNLTVGEVGARARTWKAQYARDGKALQFIVIDYLKFLRASERYRGQRHYEVGEITAGLKALAKDLSIAVVLLVQLNREVEKRADKRPELSDLRESGDIEADADVVLLLFREAYYLANDPHADPCRLEEVKFKLEIIVAKQRMGATGKVDVFCNPGASAVRDLGR